MAAGTSAPPSAHGDGAGPALQPAVRRRRQPVGADGVDKVVGNGFAQGLAVDDSIALTDLG